MDAIPLVRGIFPGIRGDGLNATRVHLQPLRHVVCPPVDDNPQVALFVVLGNVVQRQTCGGGCPIPSCCCCRCYWCRSTTQLALQYRSIASFRHQVLLDSASLVYHVPLVGSVLPEVRNDCLLPTRVNRDPLRHVDDITIDYQPRVLLGVVLLDLVHRDPLRPIIHGCSWWPVSLKVLDLGNQLLLGHLLKRLLVWLLLFFDGCCGDHVRLGHDAYDDVAQVLGGAAILRQCGCNRAACSAPRADAVQQRDAGDRPQLLEGCRCGLSCGKEALDGLPCRVEYLPIRASS
mmetsp:Transcript_109481/g.283012  ORF Transcript_109481/g.283012 Transcript_109481/m.283012 type:complete len:289 (-) Transcript_109481:180-1046(-)